MSAAWALVFRSFVFFFLFLYVGGVYGNALKGKNRPLPIDLTSDLGLGEKLANSRALKDAGSGLYIDWEAERSTLTEFSHHFFYFNYNDNHGTAKKLLATEFYLENGDTGYVGVQPQGDGTIRGVFSYFGNHGRVEDRHCSPGADGGPGVSCAYLGIPYQQGTLIRIQVYMLPDYLEKRSYFYGYIHTAGFQPFLVGVWSLDSVPVDIKTGFVQFVEHYNSENCSDLVPFRFGVTDLGGTDEYLGTTFDYKGTHSMQGCPNSFSCESVECDYYYISKDCPAKGYVYLCDYKPH